MEVNYGRRRPFSLGVEEEFQLLNGESYELSSRYDEVCEAVGGDPRVKAELMQSIVEVATHVAESVPEAIEETRDLRAQLRDAAAESGALIASAGTHPFSRYEHQEITEEPRYQELIETMQWVAERELIFGLHVHVGRESAQQAIAVANGLRTWLPELLALSVNSPFWQGRDTGLASTRVKLFDAFPRSGLPPAFSSFEEFELRVEREVRICDGQTRLESVAGLVALIQSLAATLAERYEAEGAPAIKPRTLVEENKWRAARYGLDAELIDLARDEVRPARTAALELVALAEPAARRLGCERELGEIEGLCERGSGADEQRAAYLEQGSLLAVAQWLATQT